jgi:hypothetical protein
LVRPWAQRQHVTFLDHQRSPLEADGPTASIGAELRALVRKVSGGDSWSARWSSWLLGTEIQVSRVSDTWLRTHADDWDKHGGDR